MTRFDAAVLAFRILALYFWFETLRGAAQLVVFANGDWTESIPIRTWSIPLALLAVLGLVLFLGAPAIARRLFAGDEPLSTANRPEIGALALQVCGILLFANALSRCGPLLEGRGPSHQQQVEWIATAALGAIGALLFFGAPSISRRMFGAPVKPMAQPLLAHLQAVTFSVSGIWLLVLALPELAEGLRERVQLGIWSRGAWAQIALAALGLLLFVGGVGLSALWYWIRHAGLSARAEPPR